MTSYVFTMIGNTELQPLEPDHIAQVRRHFTITGKPVWLADNEACDLFVDSPLSAIELGRQAREVLSGKGIDVACSPLDGRRKKLLISDMDSTVIDQECIDELADAFGVGPQIKKITAAGIAGEISFTDAMRQRMTMMKGLDYSLMEHVYKDRITLKTNARTLVQTMRKHGAFCILVSGGFSYFTRRVAEEIGFHDEMSNELIFEDNKLTGKVREPILGRSAKLEIMNRLCAEHNLALRDVLAVGDGANDIMMIEAAGLGVAFHGVAALKQQASACIDHTDLGALLYIQGFTKSQFVHD